VVGLQNEDRIMTPKSRLFLKTLSFAAIMTIGCGQNIVAQSSDESYLTKGKTQVREGNSFSFDNFASVLKTHVDDRGMVNYRRLLADRARLDSFAASMGTLSPEVYRAWSDDEKIAFWINAYNAFTLVAIINNYPINSTFLGRRLYPENSIRQIGAVWKNKYYPVMGKKMSLDEIEHEKLRPEFNEPRIHMALVCAAMSCPPLRNEPYYGDRLSAQLDDQARNFLNNKNSFRIDRKRNEVHLSRIFSWFGTDFQKTYGATGIASGDGEEKAVLNFVSNYLEDKDRAHVRTGNYSVKYFNYDWSLNEQ
jgi:hypothetical protein